jgi:hypothetical protein
MRGERVGLRSVSAGRRDAWGRWLGGSDSPSSSHWKEFLMVSGRSILWSFAAAMPLLGLSAWYGSQSGFCWPGCCGTKAAVPAESQPIAKTASDCCPEGSCCPECCFPGCCEDGTKVQKASCCPECCFPGCCDDGAKTQAEKPAAKVSSADDCCSGSSCCVAPATRKTATAQTSGNSCPPGPFCP